MSEQRIRDVTWRDSAACRGVDPEIFFGHGKVMRRGDPEVMEALTYCWGGCPVRRPCLRFAVDNGLSFGVFGGRLPEERKVLAERLEAMR